MKSRLEWCIAIVTLVLFVWGLHDLLKPTAKLTCPPGSAYVNYMGVCLKGASEPTYR